MDLFLTVFFVLLVVLAVLTVVAVGRLFWRIWRDNEELEPGGSMSRQMFGRTKDLPPPER